jgi:hypothetical protein
MSENAKIMFENIVKKYLSDIESLNRKIIPELEIRFGTNVKKAISKINFDNVVNELSVTGFTCDEKEGQYLLRISPDDWFMNEKNIRTKSKSRLEIIGLNAIELYCENDENINDILKLPQIDTSSSSVSRVHFTLKSDIKMEDDTYLPSANFEDFGFKVSYQNESNTEPTADINTTVVAKWMDVKKTFRYMNRVKFIHPDYPISADLSIIRSSKSNGKNQIQIVYIPPNNDLSSLSLRSDICNFFSFKIFLNLW